MIFVTHDIPVNEPGKPYLSHGAVWDGLVLKANNALPFVVNMTHCEVTNRLSDTTFDREINISGQRFVERVTLDAPRRVVFTRIAGPVLGTIANEIEGAGHDLRLRFSFALNLIAVEPGSSDEHAYAESMTDDYLRAVRSTLAAMRKLTAGDQPFTTTVGS